MNSVEDDIQSMKRIIGILLGVYAKWHPAREVWKTPSLGEGKEIEFEIAKVWKILHEMEQ